MLQRGNVTTMKYMVPSEDKYYALDESFNYMNMHRTNEVVVTHLSDKDINQKEIIEYLELSLQNLSRLVVLDPRLFIKMSFLKMSLTSNHF